MLATANKYAPKPISAKELFNNKKGIYGNATNKEINELKNEGIEVQTNPWINDKEN